MSNMGNIEANTIVTLVLMCSNLFRFYVIHEFLILFFPQEKPNRALVCLLGFFWIIDSSLILFYDLYPNFDIILYYLMILFVVSFLNGSLRLKLFAVVLIPTVNIICEKLIHRLLIFMNVEHIETIELSISSLAFFIVVLFIKKFFDLKKGELITRIEIIALIVIASISVFISVIVLDKCEDETLIILGSFSMLLLNVVVFYLLEHILELRKNQYEAGLLEQQNEAYEKQIQLMMDSEAQIVSLRHDMKNHLIVLEEMAKKEKCDELVEYLNEIGSEVYKKEEFAASRNPAFDSLINMKLGIAKNTLKAKVEADIQVPRGINIKSFDFNIIMGNLLDNALNALKKCGDDRWLTLDIKFSKSVLFILLKNSYNGEMNIWGDRILTTEEDRDKHGIGLQNVKSIVDKYNGIFDISYTDDTFIADVMLYLS